MVIIREVQSVPSIYYEEVGNAVDDEIEGYPGTKRWSWAHVGYSVHEPLHPRVGSLDPLVRRVLAVPHRTRGWTFLLTAHAPRKQTPKINFFHMHQRDATRLPGLLRLRTEARAAAYGSMVTAKGAPKVLVPAQRGRSAERSRRGGVGVAFEHVEPCA